jgi:hypothetical protein
MTICFYSCPKYLACRLHPCGAILFINCELFLWPLWFCHASFKNSVNGKIFGKKYIFDKKCILNFYNFLVENYVVLSSLLLIRVLMFVEPCTMVQFIQKNPTSCNNVSKCYYSIFIWSLTCFGRHTSHHQEPKTAVSWQRPATTRLTTFHVCKPEAASAVLGSWWWAVCHPKHVELHINM